MKKPQFVTIIVAVFAVGLLWAFGKTVNKNANLHKGHDHDNPSQNASEGVLTSSFSIDSAIANATSALSKSNIESINNLKAELSKTKEPSQKSACFSSAIQVLERDWKIIYSVCLVYCRRSKVGKFRKKPQFRRPIVFRQSATGGRWGPEKMDGVAGKRFVRKFFEVESR